MSVTSNVELERYARKAHIHLVGVFPKDALPATTFQGGYIINMSNDKTSSGIDNQGTHWVALFLNQDLEPFYFDSFGLPPPSEIMLFLSKLHSPLYYSRQQIQNETSGYCGLYCLFFLYWMQKHEFLPDSHKLLEFQKLFSTDPEDNLQKLKSYLKHFLNIKI